MVRNLIFGNFVMIVVSGKVGWVKRNIGLFYFIRKYEFLFDRGCRCSDGFRNYFLFYVVIRLFWYMLFWFGERLLIKIVNSLFVYMFKFIIMRFC